MARDKYVHKPNYRRCKRCAERAECKAMCVDVCWDECLYIEAKKALDKEKEIGSYKAQHIKNIATSVEKGRWFYV